MSTIHTIDLSQSPMHVSDEILDDLTARLRSTRWPLNADNADGFYGVRREFLQPLVEYWADGFDWRAAETRINAYEHYRVSIDNVPLHFMRKPGVGPNPIPLILSHGWPWTFWHWSKVIDQLADPAAHGGNPDDAFDVIVPSLPGFGFSTPIPQRPDMNYWKMADVFHELMTTVLGHSKYAAAGCDVGALVTGQLGHKYPGELYAIHIGSALRLDFFNGDMAWNITKGHALPDNLPSTLRREVIATQKKFAVHLTAHMLDSATLSYALADSPAGMLAWLLERWDTWSDNHGDIETVFSKDDILTHATIYWAGGGIDTSIRTYANNNRYPWTPSHHHRPVVQAPTGITFVGYENPPGVTTTEERVANFLTSDRADWYHHTNVTAHDHGGHFIPWEIPTEWSQDLRRTMRTTIGRR
ncbi:epoxide hydrolase family protein [Branchiibius cervicis]|uniref:Epoxide hydrolase family protein n=1 Tax=Branchiibius cervicis TaxID=908252 RepID=A0ABW2AXI9_9MICO